METTPGFSMRVATEKQHLCTLRREKRSALTMITSREIGLKSRPAGMPTADNFELVTVSVPAPALGEVQVKNLWMSVDPYMRGRMVDRTSYDPHLPLGEATPARKIGEVAASNSIMYGWRPTVPVGRSVARRRTGKSSADNLRAA
jgi:NADPH-dependent curcumin reductase CurA